MIRLFLASLLPSLIALVALPALALTSADRAVVRHELSQPQGGAQVTADAVIQIQGSAFRPASVTIRVGQTVAWTNVDDRDHAVVGDRNEFRSGTIKPGQSWQNRFDRAGTYNFHCPLHPRARGVVRVEE
jgi:plastocyanin